MWRGSISALAVLGMLLHAALVVRHHDIMTRTGFAQSMTLATSSVDAADQDARAALTALVGNGAIICQSDSAATQPGDGQHKVGTHCPLCVASVASPAIIPGDVWTAIVFSTERAGQIVERDQRFDVVRKLRPPSRAPPSSLV
jgi:hypothetical protein